MQMRSFALYLNQQKQKSINQQNDECLQSRQELENSKFLHQVFGNTPTQQFADVVEIRFYVSDDEIGDGRRRRRCGGMIEKVFEFDERFLSGFPGKRISKRRRVS